MRMYVPDDVHAIILGDGEEWRNQCGGHACLQRSAKGVLQKLSGDCDALFNFFSREKWGGWCDRGIDTETADFIEKEVPEFVVNRDTLACSCEAWILGAVNGKSAILVWGNSD